MTMRAKWFWIIWAHIAAVLVIGLELMSIAFACIYLVPKLKRLRADGWLEHAYSNEPVLQFFSSFLDHLNWVASHLIWFVLGFAAIWGLFECGVRSENKSFMRLSGLGTVAVTLMLVVALMAGALVLPFMLGFPAMIPLTRPHALEQVNTIDRALTAMEEALAKKDWQSLQQRATEASRALDQLEDTVGVLAWKKPVGEVRAQHASAKESLAAMEQAIRDKDTAQLEAALQTFHKAYEPLSQAAQRQ
jgi:hypothetical protein